MARVPMVFLHDIEILDCYKEIEFRELKQQKRSRYAGWVKKA